MASIRDYAVTIFSAAVTSMSCDMPSHEVGDLLVAFVGKNNNPLFTNTPAGWTRVQSVASAGAASGVFCKRSESSNLDPSPVFTLASATCMAVIVSVKNVYGATVSDAIASSGKTGVDDGVLPYTGQGSPRANYSQDIIPGPPPGDAELADFGTNFEISATETNTNWESNTNALLLHGICGLAFAVTASPPWVNIFAGDSGTNGVTVSYSVEPTSNIPVVAPDHWAYIIAETRSYLLEIRDGSGGMDTSPYIPLNTVPTTLISPFSGQTGTVDKGNYLPVANAWLKWLRGKPVTSIVQVQTADAGYNPFWGATNTAGSSSTTNLAQTEWNSNAAFELGSNNGSLLFGTYMPLTPRDYLDTGGRTQGGVYIVLGTNNYNTILAPGPPPGSAELQDFDITSFSFFEQTIPGPPPGEVSTENENMPVTFEPEVFTTSIRKVIPAPIVDLETFSTSFRAFNGGTKQFMRRTDSSPYRSWIVGAQFSSTEKADARSNYLIDTLAGDTIYETQGGPAINTLDWVGYGSSGYYGAASYNWSLLWAVKEVQLAGGTPSTPFGFDALVNTVNRGAGDIPLMQQAGALATCWTPLKFGGNKNIGISLDLNTLQFPRKADKVRYLDFHVPNDRIGIEFDGLGAQDLLSFTNCLFTSPSSYYWRFDASHSASTNMNFDGSTVVKANVTLQSTVTLSGMAFINCTNFTLNDAVLNACAFTNTKVSAAAPGDLAGVTNSTFKSSGTGHGIEVGGTAADVNLTGLTFTGYASSSGSTGNEAIYVNIPSGNVTLTILGGGSIPSIRTAGAVVTVVVAPVTLSVHVQDINTSAAIAGARVWVPVSSGAGGRPYNASVTITSSGGTATVAHTGHGLANNDWVWIQGANELEYNGTRQITVTGVDSYTYIISGGPASPATGTITSTFVIINAATNGSGDATATYTYAANQPVSGRARTASGATKYKTAPIAGTISSLTGLSLTVQMIPDQ